VSAAQEHLDAVNADAYLRATLGIEPVLELPSEDEPPIDQVKDPVSIVEPDPDVVATQVDEYMDRFFGIR
jgi:hypothetical protein